MVQSSPRILLAWWLHDHMELEWQEKAGEVINGGINGGRGWGGWAQATGGRTAAGHSHATWPNSSRKEGRH